MEFRPRNYGAELESHALPRVPTAAHPLSASPPSPPLAQVLLISQLLSHFFLLLAVTVPTLTAEKN